jgi:hypothetical protein
MTPKREEKANGLTREEAQLTLDKILKRYRIHPSDPARGYAGGEGAARCAEGGHQRTAFS